MTETEDLNRKKVETIINYLFTGTMATDDEIIVGLENSPASCSEIPSASG